MAWAHWILADALVEAELAVARQTWRALVRAYAGISGTSLEDAALRRLQRRGLLERCGHGAKASFRVTAAGGRQALQLHPSPRWDAPWDGSWRVVVFDLPETRRKDRHRLWRALRARKLGVLQRSVWIWPAPLEPILEEVIVAEGVPECFCGFETRRVFLCTNSELVVTAWDFEEINRRQRAYLHQPAGMIAAIGKARNLTHLAAVGRAEWLAYEHAFSCDPLLPRALWPAEYQGPLVHEQHLAFRRCFRQRLSQLSAAE